MKKRIILTMLALCLVLGMMPGRARADDQIPSSGSCGKNLTWSYANKTLTISGIGDMDNFSEDYVDYVNENLAPWYGLIRGCNTIVIEDGVTSIGNLAFFRLLDVTSITIPNSVTRIGDFAFCNCSALTTIVIPESVIEMGEGVFSGCIGLTDIPDVKNITSINAGTFGGCTGLKQITIPEHITSIGEMAFSACEGLTDLVIPSSVTDIGDKAFSSCTGLTRVTIPNSVNNFGENIFQFCSGIREITFQEGVTTIGEAMFRKCESIESITIPDSVTHIDREAFSSCNGLTSITIPGSVKSFGKGIFYGCENLTDVEFLDGVTQIPFWCFSKCKRLTNVTIPGSVVSIDQAFSFCDNLSDVYYGGTKEQWELITINADSSDPLLRVNLHFSDTPYIPDDGHIHNYIPGEPVPPTCETRGYTIYTCECGDTYRDNETPAVGHSYGGWTVMREATETHTGLRERSCGVCGNTQSEIIPKLDPEPSEPSRPSKPSEKPSKPEKPTEKPVEPEIPAQPETPVQPEEPVAPAPVYDDVAPEAWYSEAATYVASKGLMTGTSEGNFSPNEQMTRAMVWTVLGRMAGADVDGSGSEWYAKAQAWAAASGVSDGTNPNGGVTRQELAVMLWRSAGSPEGTAEMSAFSDGGEVAEWASAAMRWAVANGVLNGDNGALKPGAPASRAEVAAMLMRFCEKMGL